MSAYRISTITATGSLNSEVDLDVLYGGLSCYLGGDVKESIVNDVIYIEFGKNRKDMGHLRKFINRQMRMMSSTKRFDNQVTIVYKLKINDMTCMLNTKVFKNGNVQMTGIRSIDQGRQMIDIIISIIKHMCDNGYNCVETPSELESKDYKLRLINSDFKIGYQIHRDNLFKILLRNDATCSFEPCIYPAVKIKYYYNSDNDRKDGVCYCSKKCMIGKSAGSGDMCCKKVTIAVFQSGCVIITGGQSIEQINEAYQYILSVLTDNIDKVKKKIVLVHAPKLEQKQSVRVMVKASAILPYS